MQGGGLPKAASSGRVPSALHACRPAVECGGARSTWLGWAEGKRRGTCSRRFLNVLWWLLRPTVLRGPTGPPLGFL